MLGRFIDRPTYSASRAALKEWATKPSSEVAVWWSVSLLRSYLLGSGPLTMVQFGDEEDTTIRGKRNNPSAERPDFCIPTHWVYYLSALCIWAYGVFASGRAGRVDAPAAAAAALSANAATSQEGRAKESTAPQIVNFREYEAIECLERLGTRTPEELKRIDVRANMYGVLELVYRELRANRWSLARESAGVLRKLFQTPITPTTAVTPAVTRPSTPRKETQLIVPNDAPAAKRAVVG